MERILVSALPLYVTRGRQKHSCLMQGRVPNELLVRLVLRIQHLLCTQVSQKSVKEEVQHGEELINLLKGFTEQLVAAKEVQDEQKCASFPNQWSRVCLATKWT